MFHFTIKHFLNHNLFAIVVYGVIYLTLIPKHMLPESDSCFADVPMWVCADG